MTFLNVGHGRELIFAGVRVARNGMWLGKLTTYRVTRLSASCVAHRRSSYESTPNSKS